MIKVKTEEPITGEAKELLISTSAVDTSSIPAEPATVDQLPAQQASGDTTFLEEAIKLKNNMIGQIVKYRLAAYDVRAIHARYEDSLNHKTHHSGERDGKQSHYGNPHEEGQICPMIVVVDWGQTCVGGQVFLDGIDNLWISIARQGADLGQWSL